MEACHEQRYMLIGENLTSDKEGTASILKVNIQEVLSK